MYKLIQSGHKNLLILYIFTACSSGGSNPVEMIPSQNLVSETAPSISNSIAIDSNLDLIWQDEFTQKMIDDGDEMWKVHQKYPDDFKSYNFSIYDMIGVMDETKDFYELPRYPINEKYGDY